MSDKTITIYMMGSHDEILSAEFVEKPKSYKRVSKNEPFVWVPSIIRKADIGHGYFLSANDVLRYERDVCLQRAKYHDEEAASKRQRAAALNARLTARPE